MRVERAVPWSATSALSFLATESGNVIVNFAITPPLYSRCIICYNKLRQYSAHLYNTALLENNTASTKSHRNAFLSFFFGAVSRLYYELPIIIYNTPCHKFIVNNNH